jgi:2-octaprenylphenol hydroxylase
VSRDFDVVVIGGGTVGATMAALLGARRLAAAGRVALIADAAGAPATGASAAVADDWDLRVFALSRASQRLLQLCGTWQRLPQSRLHPFERMCVWDASGSPKGAGSLTFDCAEIGEPDLGFIVEGRALARASLESAGTSGAVVIEGAVQTLRVDEREARIRLADGRDLAAKLVIAADGAASRSRELLGIETAGHPYHQDALVAHVRTAQSHRNTAWQRFLPTGPLAFLPLPDGRSSIVWTVAQEESRQLRSLEPGAFAAALETASAGGLGAIELTTPVASFPLQLKVAVDYLRTRAVLLGDAGHAVHPLAGQGLNLGLLDCAALADALAPARGNAYLLGEPRLLRGYERWRKSENMLAATALDALERLFSSSNPLIERLRGSGLRAVGRLPALKRALALRALGVSGDVPAFLRTSET